MNLNLTGKTALVTAASGGIGSGVAEALAEAGVRVAISGRTLRSLKKVAESLASRAGGRPVIVVGDVGAKGGPAQIAAEVTGVLRRNEESRIYAWHAKTGQFPPRRRPKDQEKL